MQLRYLQEATLNKTNKIKQSNGVYLDEYEEISIHKVQIQTLEDEVSATIYGANISKILRIKSPNKELEKYLISKLSNKEDNISKYFIFIDNVKYKINSVTLSKIDIERYQ